MEKGGKLEIKEESLFFYKRSRQGKVNVPIRIDTNPEPISSRFSITELTFFFKSEGNQINKAIAEFPSADWKEKGNWVFIHGNDRVTGDHIPFPFIKVVFDNLHSVLVEAAKSRTCS